MFAGTRRLQNFNDLSGLTLQGIRFAEGAGNFWLEGRALGIAGEIRNESGKGQTLLMDLSVSGTQNRWIVPSHLPGNLWLIGRVSLADASQLELEGNVRIDSAANDFVLPSQALMSMGSGAALVAKSLLLRGRSELSLDGASVRVLDDIDLADGLLQVKSGGSLAAGGDLTLRGGQLLMEQARVGNVVGGTLRGPQRSQQGAYALSLSDSFLTVANLDMAGSLSLAAGSTLKSEGQGIAKLSVASLAQSRLEIGGALQFSNPADASTYQVKDRLILNDATMVVSGDISGVFSQVELTQYSGLLAGAMQWERLDLRLNRSTMETGETSLAQSRVSMQNPSHWRVSGGLALQASELALDGALLETVGPLTLKAGSTLGLLNSRLDVAALQLTDSTLDWRGGSLLRIGGQVTTWLTDLGSQHLTLQAGNTLDVVNTLRIASPSVLTLRDGTLRAGTLALDGGRIAGPSGVLDMDDIGLLRGSGSVEASVRGGRLHRIVADGRLGADGLSLGNAASPEGFAFEGELDVGSARVELRDANQAQLGLLTRLGAGGRLVAANGMALDAGELLRADGASSVQGALRNNGRVQSGNGLLSLLGDVDGEGSFGGRLHFAAGFNPGAGALSLDFGGGHVSLGDHAVLTLQILGAGLHDALRQIGTLGLDGTLRIELDTNFEPLAGQRFDLLDWTLLNGRFDDIDWRAAPLGAGLQWDVSRLYVDGSIGVLSMPAVPEPQAWALMLLGLGGVAVAKRRRR